MSEDEIYNYLISFISSKIKEKKLNLQDMAGFNLGYLLTEDLQKAVQGLMDLRKEEKEEKMCIEDIFKPLYIPKSKLQELREIDNIDLLQTKLKLLLEEGE